MRLRTICSVLFPPRDRGLAPRLRAMLVLCGVLAGAPAAPAQPSQTQPSQTQPSQTQPRLATRQPVVDLHLVEYGDDLALRDRLVASAAVYADVGRHVFARLDGARAAALAVGDREVASLPEIRPGEVVLYAARTRSGAGPLHGRLLLSRRAFFVTAVRPAQLPDDCGGSGFHGGLQVVSLARPYLPQRVAPPERVAMTTTPDPVIAGLVGQVAQANLQAHVNALSAIHSRRTTRPGNAQAVAYVTNQLAGSPGLSVTTESFAASYGPNVIAELPGTDLADEIVMVGAHLDSIVSRQPDARAPGADDNASGSAAVLELARLMAGQRFRRTIRFAWWNAEELGLLGSEDHAQAARVRGERIVAYLNTDMNAYRAAGDALSIDFVLNDSTSSLLAAVGQSIQTYLPGTQVNSGNLFGGTSDHRSFYRNGFPSLFVFEDVGQYSPYIHTTNDVVGTSANDFQLSKLITQGVLAGAADLAEVAPGTPGSFTIFGRGCNGSGSVPAPCGAVNPHGGFLTGDTRSNEYAYRVPNSGSAQLTSFELFTNSTTGGDVTVPAYVYADAGGGPADQPLAATTLTVGIVSRFYRATLATPVAVNGDFWVAVDHSAQTTVLSSLAGGETGVAHYRRPPATGTWQRSGLVTRPSVRVQCDGGQQDVVPAIGHRGVGSVGRSFEVTIDHAAPGATLALLFGISDQFWYGGTLPVTLPRAPGCQLLVSNEFVESATAGPGGAASRTVDVPDVSALIGSEVYHQWIVMDAAANPLGVAVSAAARSGLGG